MFGQKLVCWNMFYSQLVNTIIGHIFSLILTKSFDDIFCLFMCQYFTICHRNFMCQQTNNSHTVLNSAFFDATSMNVKNSQNVKLFNSHTLDFTMLIRHRTPASLSQLHYQRDAISVNFLMETESFYDMMSPEQKSEINSLVRSQYCL